MKLQPINKDFIKVNDLAVSLNIKESIAKKILDLSTTVWSFKKYYIAQCQDCGKVIEKSTRLVNILGKTISCDGPHEEELTQIISRQNINIVYGK